MKNNLNEKEFNCTGCSLCSNICPVNAISITMQNGFYKFNINQEKCIGCGLCLKKCPQINEILSKNEVLKCYSAYSTDLLNVKASSSGGIFSEIAKYVLKNNGIVVGATYENGKVVHKLIDNQEKLDKLRGSKYLQSYIGNTYSIVKEKLNEEKMVLFCGTPCQCAAMKKFIKHDNLYVLDLVCHGVPSFAEFEKSLKDRFNTSELSNINFRYKKNGWREYFINYKFEAKNIRIRNNYDDFFKSYLKNLILNACCYDCKFSSKNRYGDITLSDFWGIEKIDKQFSDNNKNIGISGVLINNEKGKYLFDEIKNNLIFKEQDFKKLEEFNPRISCGKYSDEMYKKRQEFMNSNYKYKINTKDELYDAFSNSLIARAFRKVIRMVKK